MFKRRRLKIATDGYLKQTTKVALVIAVSGYLSFNNPSDLEVLKRWDGNSWTKAKGEINLSSLFVVKTLKRWNGSSWKEVDITGIKFKHLLSKIKYLFLSKIYNRK